MSNVLFTPKAYQEQTQSSVPHENRPVLKKDDKIGMTLLKSIRFVIVSMLFLLPVFFVPQLAASLGFDKVMVVLTLGLVVVVLSALAILRQEKLTTVLPLPLLLFLLFVVSAFLSAFLSGDIQDSLRGSVLEVQTAGFFAVMFLAMVVPLFLQRSKIMTLSAMLAFGIAGSLVILYNIVRLISGPDFLQLSSFGALTVSPIGGFNDLAILAALIVMVGLVTLLQLPLKKLMQVSVVGLILLATVVLMAVNFFFLWIAVGFFGLLFLIYVLSKDTLFSKSEEVSNEASTASPLIIFVALAVCVVSGLFVVAGDFMGAQIGQVTQVNYIEVRPSMSATIDMMKAVYKEDILLGSGPNRFSDVWRLNKDMSINETNFWNVDFASGFGFSPTVFVSLGILGGLLLFAFHMSYLYLGYKMLLKNETDDSFWYYVGTASFVASLLLWVVTYVYAPGAAILLLTAMFTGMTFVAYNALVPSSSVTIPLVNSRKRGFFLMAVAVVMVVASVMILLSVGKQYIAQANFNRTQATATTIEEFELGIQSSFELYQDNRFVESLAQAKLITLRQLLNTQEPTQADQEQFAAIAQQTILLGQEAARLDPSDPNPHAILVNVYYALAQAGLEGAMDQARASLEDAKWRDPLDPSYALQAAYMSAQSGDLNAARLDIQDSLKLKRNFGEALFLLAQIDIQEGDVESAIATTQQLITFEPNNPTRFYQLGILLAANKQLDDAITAYQSALTRDPNFANARYMLALTLIEKGDTRQALEQLKVVRESNQDNTDLQEIIRKIESGEPVVPNTGLETPVSESSTSETTEDGVITNSDTDTNLISPVNTPNGEASQENPAPANTEGASPAAQ